MRKINKPPREVKKGDVVYCFINGKIEKCVITNLFINPCVQILKDKKEYEEEHFEEYSVSYPIKLWKYGREWALTKEELE